MGEAPIPDDKNTNTNFYEANSWWQNKIKSFLSSMNESLNIQFLQIGSK